MSRVDESFPTMGGVARVILAATGRSEAELAGHARAIRALMADVEQTLTRFDPASPLSRFNRGADAPGQPAPVHLRRLALAARWAGEQSDGLVDATRLGPLREASAPRADLAEALAAAPARRPAGAHPDRAYAALRVTPGGAVLRAPDAGLDGGGLAKGLAADLAAGLLPADVRGVVAVCGDLAVHGGDQEVLVDPAFPGATPTRLTVRPGGVATSSIHARLWRREDGAYAHHLLDPATGEPAWTGLVAVTACAGSALEAEVLAKQALLSGPARARRLLRRRGGVLQHENGRLERLAPAPVVRLKVAA